MSSSKARKRKQKEKSLNCQKRLKLELKESQEALEKESIDPKLKEVSIVISYLVPIQHSYSYDS